MKSRFILVLTIFGFAVPAVAPAGVNLLTDGVEFRANGFTINSQTGVRGGAVSRSADGSFVIVWSGNGSTDAAGAFLRRFNAAGTAQGGDVRVNTYTTSTQRDPFVGSADDGSFVIIWDSFGQDGSDRGIFGQRYDATGAAAGTEFQINTYTTGAQFEPAVGVTAAGSFVAVWTSLHDSGSRGVFGRRYDSSGGALGTEFLINSYTTGNQQRGMIDYAADGSFVVTWDSVQDGDLDGVFGQRFDSSGNAVGGEFQANTFTTGAQRLSDVAVADDGSFVVAWTSSQDGDAEGVFGQRFTAAGATAGTEFQINTYTTGSQQRPAVDADDDGSFVVVWRGDGQDGDGEGLFAQCFDAAGAPSSGEFQVNTYTTGPQNGGNAVAGDGVGNFAITWTSTGQDGSSDGTYAQQFCNDADADLVCDRDDVCPGFDDSADADSDGLPDGCDACPADPDNDVDGDLICGDVDNCPNDANPGQENADGDINGDACDLCPGFDDSIDADGDSAPDACDLCPGFDDNVDADSDGVPDGCDLCPGFDDAIDADTDGVPDGCDLCPGFDDNADADSDGVPDGCDLCPGFDDGIDTDGDTVPDGCDACAGFDDNDDVDADGTPDGCDDCSALAPDQNLTIKPQVLVKKINTDTTVGNDGLKVLGEFILPVGSDFSAIQPLVTAIRVVMTAGGGVVKLDETLATTGFGGSGTAGWKQNGSGSKWTFIDKTASPANGITKLSFQDKSKKSARRVKLQVKGKNGNYPIVSGEEPPVATVIFGAGGAGECTSSVFTAVQCGFSGSGKKLKCTQ